MSDPTTVPADTFVTDDEASAYATTYYGDATDAGTQALLAELFQTFSQRRSVRILDYGCGPTVYVPLLASPFAESVCVWDPSPRARAYIRRWLGGADDSLWATYAEYVAVRQSEDASTTKVALAARKATRILGENPFPKHVGSFDVVVANFSLEADAKTVDEWMAENGRVAQLVAPGGTYFAAYLVGARTWRVKDSGPLVAATNLTEADVLTLASALGLEAANVTTVPLNRELYDGFAILTGTVPHVHP